MENKNIKTIVSIAVVLTIGTIISLVGSHGSVKIGNLSLYALAIIVAFAIQWIVFIPSFIFKTEKFFDLTGSITYITVIVLSLLISPFKDFRSFLILILVTIWALRLGIYLYKRIKRVGEDRRFRELKNSFPRFLLTWTLQGLWVTFSLAAALVVITSENRVDFDIFAAVGIILWLFGFAIEVIADNQKRLFKADPNNNDKFISNGLWSWSRHPNYFGEIVLWIGIAVVALPVLSGWTFATLISPVFVTILLTKISGIPMLEKRADEKWGGQSDYEKYKKNTSILVPKPTKGV
jgi:steroid 5-alpha reductase family enzyme